MNFVLLSTIADALDVSLRRRSEIDNLPVLKGIEAMVLDLQVAQQHDDDLFAVVLGLADLGETFGRRKRIGRGEQDHGLASGIRLAQ